MYQSISTYFPEDTILHIQAVYLLLVHLKHIGSGE